MQIRISLRRWLVWGLRVRCQRAWQSVLSKFMGYFFYIAREEQRFLALPDSFDIQIALDRSDIFRVNIGEL